MPFHAPRAVPRCAYHVQRGALLVQFALLALVLLALLGVIQIGYMYSAKRDLQRIADLAALESVNGFKNASVCTDAQKAGTKSINAQWPPEITAKNKETQVECGYWTVKDGYKGNQQNNGVFNAARVTLVGQTLKLVPFTGNSEVMATATAALPPSDATATFSVGAGVVKLNDGLLNALLSSLLGTKINLSLADYQGLANSKVNLLWLTEALNLGAGGYDELLGTTVDLKTLLQASIQAAARSGESTADVGINALEKLLGLALPVDLNGLRLNLLKNGIQKGLLELGVDSNDPLAGLQANTSLLDILMVGLQVANKDSAISIPGTVLNLKPVADATVQVKIIEPPTIASGRAGIDKATGQYITKAHNGQIRALIKLKALTALSKDNNLLDLNLLLIHLKVSMPSTGALLELPVNLEVGSADARLEEIMCHVKASTHKARIGTKPGLAYISLADMPEAMTNTTQAWTNLKKDRFHLLDLRVEASALLDILKILDAPVKVMAKLDVPIENTNSYQLLEYEYAMDKPYSNQAAALTKTAGSRQQIGQSIGNALGKNLLDVELDTSGLKLLNIKLDFLTEILNGLVNNVVKIVGGLLPIVRVVLDPILALLDSVLGPLLQLLGVQIGYADVQLHDIACNPAQLVE